MYPGFIKSSQPNPQNPLKLQKSAVSKYFNVLTVAEPMCMFLDNFTRNCESSSPVQLLREEDLLQAQNFM